MVRSTRLWHGLAVAAAGLILFHAESASAEDIPLTGPLAGAPAGRKLRLHRENRFELAPSVSFSLLDEYQRTIMPGIRATYHFADWIGVGVYGGFGFQNTTALADEIQRVGIDERNCEANPSASECRLTSINLTRGSLADDQLGAMKWMVAPQLTVVPFRGKLALFGELFVDTDVNFFAGPAFIGVEERAPCGFDTEGATLTSCSQLFALESRVAVAPTFGLGLNFYPSGFLGFGAEWRAVPFAWNTGGFDVGGNNSDFPDTAVNGNDREFHFNSLVSIYVSLQLPTAIKVSE